MSGQDRTAASRFPKTEPGSSAADVDGIVSPSGPQDHHESVGERQGRQPGSDSSAATTLPPSPPQDRTLAVTVGKWGGFYRIGGPGCWRVCAGPVAVTYLRAEFSNVMEAWLDRLDARRSFEAVLRGR